MTGSHREPDEPGPFTGQHAKSLSRRDWLTKNAQCGIAGLASLNLSSQQLRAAESQKALVAITLDLEMSRNFPRWEDRHWDYEKGNLNTATKRYSVEAARRVKAAGGVLHFFAVGRVFEQPKVDWIKQIVRQGHPIGNHTYDHVNVRATRKQDVQFRFRRSPWLVEDLTPAQIIRNNIRLCNLALKNRIGIEPSGFRTPGGFSDGLRDRADVRAILLELGFGWISSLYPPHPNTKPMQQPDRAVLDGIVAAQEKAQPFVYPDGLVEVPMSPISDIGAFRTGRWRLEWFLKAIRMAVEWTIEHRAVFDFLAHPSCLYVVDPEFKSIDLICQMVRKAQDRAMIVDLHTIAKRAQLKK